MVINAKLLNHFIAFIFLLPNGLLSEVLSFEQAVAKTLSFSPALRIADSEIQEAAGVKNQSARLPNPVAAWSVENVFGNKDWQGWESAESRYEIGQLIEMGGKRKYRMQTAKFQYYAMQAGFESKQLSLLNHLLKSFVNVVAAQELLEVSWDQTLIADEAYQAVAAKVEAGKVSLIQKNKAEIALFAARISYDKADAEFIKSKEKLALLWGAMCPDFDRVEYPFYEIDIPVSMEQCLDEIKANPLLVKSQMDAMAAYQSLNLEKSRAVPDITVSLGYKTLQDTGNKGMILGASIPLLLFDQNQGNIEKARAQRAKAQDQYLELELALENKLSLSCIELRRAYDEAEKIRTTILAASVESFELAKEGYKEGKFEYLDMLDSQKTLFEVKERYIQALLNYHHSRADIEYLYVLEGS